MAVARHGRVAAEAEQMVAGLEVAGVEAPFAGARLDRLGWEEAAFEARASAELPGRQREQPARGEAIGEHFDEPPAQPFTRHVVQNAEHRNQIEGAGGDRIRAIPIEEVLRAQLDLEARRCVSERLACALEQRLARIDAEVVRGPGARVQERRTEAAVAAPEVEDAEGRGRGRVVAGRRAMRDLGEHPPPSRPRVVSARVEVVTASRVELAVEGVQGAARRVLQIRSPRPLRGESRAWLEDAD